MQSTTLRQLSSKEKELGVKRGNSYMATLGETCPIYIEEEFTGTEVDIDTLPAELQELINKYSEI